MEWFRSYVGTTTDPKFRVVAKKSGVRIGDVLAIWQMLLERACGADERGRVDGFDCEGADALLDLEEGQACAVYAAMEAKGLVQAGHIAAWDKRQPKREREDDSAARVKAHRDRKKQSCNAICDNVTPCNATQRQETPRGEEIREEENTKTPPIPPSDGVGGDYDFPDSSQEPDDAFDPSDMPSIDFEQFFDAFPKQVDKIKAWNAWRKLGRARPGLDFLLVAIVEQSQSDQWTRDHGRYIPSPAKWLQERKWLDKLSPAPTSPAAGQTSDADWMRFAGSCVKQEAS